MKISRIRAWQTDLPIDGGAYKWADKDYAAFDSTIVLIDTDDGVSGVGESCPLGPSYLAAYSEGVRTGLGVLAPQLIGTDPMQLDVMSTRMDALMKGHPYVKSAVDMACHDLAGKALGVPVSQLLGGAHQDSVMCFRVINRDDPSAMVDQLESLRAEGYLQYQMKVGTGVADDVARIEAVTDALVAGEVLAADANTSWKTHEAIAIANAVADRPVYLEQPCLSYEECLRVREHTDLPMILDESMTGLDMVLRGAADGAMDLINLKINKVGGLVRARQVRDLCVQLGIVMTVEDTWGSEVASAAIAHLAQSVPEGFHFQSSPFHAYNVGEVASGGPIVENGRMRPTPGPGLGVDLHIDTLGDPILDVT